MTYLESSDEGLQVTAREAYLLNWLDNLNSKYELTDEQIAAIQESLTMDVTRDMLAIDRIVNE